MESKLVLTTIKKTSEKIDISFIVPTYKNREYLNSAIDSILSQSGVFNSKMEIIVICNDPLANLDEQINKYQKCKIPLRIYINKENYGQVGNLNQAISLAEGEYISILHDDDLLLPNYLEAIEKCFKISKKPISCILPSCYLMYKSYKFDFRHKFLSAVCFPRFMYRKYMQDIIPENIVYTFDNVYGPPSCGALFKKAELIKFGLFKDVHGAAWDYYNFRRLNEIIDIVLLHKYVGIRRADSGMSMNQRVRDEFVMDRRAMIEDELSDNRYVQKYADVIINRRPFVKMIWWRFTTKLYFYYHNLDSKKVLSYSQYKMYSKKR